MSPVAAPGPHGKSIVRLEGATKRYGKLEILAPLDLDVQDGEFLTILGPSGSGKTTIIRMIGGFTSVSSGRILLEGEDISNVPTFRRPFTTVFQDYALFPHMSVRRNVGYSLSVRGRPRAEIDERVGQVLSVVGLEGKGDRFPSQLSGGQRQRVALARAIIGQPRMVLLDEPLGALDASLRRTMQLFLKDIQKRIATTFVFITHDQEEAMTMSDRIVVMNHGRVEQIGSPSEIYNAPRTEFVARFIGDNNMLPAVVTSESEHSVTVSSPLGLTELERPQEGVTRSMLLSVRPEHLSILTKGDQSGSCAQADVIDSAFVGAYWHVTAKLRSGGEVLRLLVPVSDAAAGVAEGDHISIGWSPGRLRLIPRGETQP